MKKRSINKFLFIFLFLITFAQFIFSKDFSFQILPFSGVEFSSISEYYYYEKTPYSEGQKLKSLLEWNQRPSLYFGLEGKVNYGNTCLSLKGDVKMPLKCGSMYDSDYTESGMKFNYSINESTIVNGFDFAASLSRVVDLDFVTVQPEVLCNWSSISIKARNGYGWYGSWEHTSDNKTHHWSDTESHYYPDGKKHLGGVDYKNHVVSIYTGFEVSKTIYTRWENTLGFYVAPFTYAYAKDTHVGSISFYTEDFIYIYFNNFKILAKTAWQFSEKIKLQLSAQYEWCIESIGEDYHDGYKNDSDGGISFKKTRVELGLQYKIK